MKLIFLHFNSLYVTPEQRVRGSEGKSSGRYTGRKITASLGNVTIKEEKIWKGKGGSTAAKSLSEHVECN
jgi:hypothetical protein